MSRKNDVHRKTARFQPRVQARCDTAIDERRKRYRSCKFVAVIFRSGGRNTDIMGLLVFARPIARATRKRNYNRWLKPKTLLGRDDG